MTNAESRLRTAACWMTVVVSLWSLSYYYAFGTKEGSAFIIEDLTVPLISQFDISWENGARLVMLVAPLLLLTNFCQLVVTSAPLLGPYLQIGTNLALARFRGFSGMAGARIAKKNQFGLGELNFDALSSFLVTIPCIFFFFSTLLKVLSGPEIESEVKLKAVGNAFGMTATLALSFFLIPVTRHSVLLVAMGWSPLQALRIHVWAGYTSFVSVILHGLIHFVVWIRKEDVNLWEQVMPDPVCWEWKPKQDTPRNCRIQFYNFTGLLAFFFFAVLILTSLNRFRRRYYRLFYIFHTICGIGMLATAVMHWRPIITYVAPSLIYYLASTMPALVQALASWARGGVKIVKVVHLSNAGGCKEIHIATTESANTALNTVPSMFIKMCVPSISMVWHPFTVFKHPQDPSTVRILFRPVGPFTKQLALIFEQEKIAPTILDGFYHAGNRTIEALHHDHILFYCGGVAITPFLSLIPHLIAEIAKLKELGNQVKTKKLVFVWACREEGLSSYVTENYLMGMKMTADTIGFEFEIILYHTNRKAKIVPAEDRDDVETVNVVDTTFLSALSIDQVGVEAGKSVSVRGAFGICEQEAPSAVGLTEEKHKSLRQFYEITEYAHEEGAVHDMELHRFMPARHALVWYNLPALIGVGGLLWLSFYIIFSFYRAYDIHVHDFYDRLWPLIVCFMTSLALCSGFEAIALFASAINRKFKGKQVEIRPANSPTYTLVDEDVVQHKSAVEHRSGRPDVADIFQESRQAECPAIFMCGPPAITENVRQEANKENSIFGLTRYALYEDPFEM